MKIDVAVIGAGAAGIGIGSILKRLGIDFTIIEKDSVGSSFKKWPKETKFISPSFTGNFFKMPDLNAITPDSSPAFSLETEHPTGKQYATYLKGVSDHYELPVNTGINVTSIKKEDDAYNIITNKEIIKSKIVIWAAGEYQYPKKNSFKGEKHTTHSSKITSFKNLPEDTYLIIGGYESGFDAAIQLSKAGKKAILLDSKEELQKITSDSSYSLSPYTRDQYKKHYENIKYYTNANVTKVTKEKNTYKVYIKNESEPFKISSKPINATGFASSLSLVKEHFHFKPDIILNDFDESTKNKNFYLTGPQVKHNNSIFCFIYKFRQRFAIIAKHIAKKLNVKQELIDEVTNHYKEQNFYLEDLSCCENECEC